MRPQVQILLAPHHEDPQAETLGGLLLCAAQCGAGGRTAYLPRTCRWARAAVGDGWGLVRQSCSSVVVRRSCAALLCLPAVWLCCVARLCVSAGFFCRASLQRCYAAWLCSVPLLCGLALSGRCAPGCSVFAAVVRSCGRAVVRWCSPAVLLLLLFLRSCCSGFFVCCVVRSTAARPGSRPPGGCRRCAARCRTAGGGGRSGRNRGPRRGCAASSSVAGTA